MTRQIEDTARQIEDMKREAEDMLQTKRDAARKLEAQIATRSEDQKTAAATLRDLKGQLEAYRADLAFVERPAVDMLAVRQQINSDLELAAFTVPQRFVERPHHRGFEVGDQARQSTLAANVYRGMHINCNSHRYHSLLFRQNQATRMTTRAHVSIPPTKPKHKSGVIVRPHVEVKFDFQEVNVEVIGQPGRGRLVGHAGDQPLEEIEYLGTTADCRPGPARESDGPFRSELDQARVNE